MLYAKLRGSNFFHVKLWRICISANILWQIILYSAKIFPIAVISDSLLSLGLVYRILRTWAAPQEKSPRKTAWPFTIIIAQAILLAALDSSSYRPFSPPPPPVHHHNLTIHNHHLDGLATRETTGLQYSVRREQWRWGQCFSMLFTIVSKSLALPPL